MEWTCDCGAIIIFPTPERRRGFIVSEAVCPNCGQIWKAYIVKSGKIRR